MKVQWSEIAKERLHRIRIMVWVEREDGSGLQPLVTMGASPSELTIGGPTVTELQAASLALIAMSYDRLTREFGLSPEAITEALSPDFMSVKP